MPGPLNYTTKVASSVTLAEVHDLLREHGADAVATAYTDRRVTGVQFHFQGHAYDLPVDVDAMQRVLDHAVTSGPLKGTHANKTALRSRDHAERVAWRVVKDWLEAQLALVAAQQVPLDEVMLPYLITVTGRPLRTEWRDHPLALTGSSGG